MLYVIVHDIQMQNIFSLFQWPDEREQFNRFLQIKDDNKKYMICSVATCNHLNIICHSSMLVSYLMNELDKTKWEYQKPFIIQNALHTR